MKDVAGTGLIAARHLRGEVEVYEVRADAERQAFRVLFAQETSFILLSLSGFQKKRQRKPPDEIALAETRLADWRRRARRSSSLWLPSITLEGMPKDFLDEVIASRSRKNPRFPDLVAEAEHGRARARSRFAARERRPQPNTRRSPHGHRGVGS